MCHGQAERVERIKPLGHTPELTNVLAQDILNLLLVETTTENQTLGSVHRSLGTQLGVEEHEDVLGLTMHTTANVDKVCKRRLLCALTSDLGWNDSVPALLSCELGVVEVKKGEEALQQLVVGRFTALGDPHVETANLCLGTFSRLEQVVLVATSLLLVLRVKVVKLEC